MALTNIVTNIDLDVYDHDLTPTTIKAIALDSKTRYVAAALLKERNPYGIPQTASVTLTVLRPDNTGVQITGSTYSYDADGTTMYGAYAELTQLAIAIKGACKAQFKITDGDQILRTEIFGVNNGQALDADITDWAGDLDGHNLDEMAESIETLESAVGTLQTDVSSVKEDLNAYAYATDVVIMPDSLRKIAFNPSTGTTASNTARLTYLGGFELRGAKAVDVEISNGYKWNIYFANVFGSYELISQYSDSWVGTSESFIPVPDDANRLYIQCIKTDGSDFTDEEIATVFKVKFRGAEEKEIYDYDYDTDFTTNYYGNYQYVNGSIQDKQYARLTQDRFYKINELKIIRLKPADGYKAVINFFDSDFVGLGNNGAWITGHTLIIIPNLYATAKYFKITIVRTDNAVMSATDYNKFSVLYYSMTNLAPVLGKLDLKYVDSWDFTSGDTAIYNGIIFVGNTGKLTVNGVDIVAEIGHGNNIMFGKELYNDFPKLYAGGFYSWNKCVFVNSVTNNSATLLDTITFDALPTGYVNMCVDEDNERFYIFEETGADTYQGEILFAVCDFSGNVLSQKMLDISIPIIQGMDFMDGFCYVTSGDGTETYPNYLMVFDTDGNLLSKSAIDIGHEVEGISIDKNKIYIKGLKILLTLC